MSASEQGLFLEETARFYDRVAGVYDRRFSYSRRATDIQAFWLKLKCRAGSILDLGCGTGRMLRPLGKAGFDLTGLDCSPKMIARARARHDEAKLVLADGCQGLPFCDACFDNVISLHASVIHATLWEDLMELSAEILRVLKPGGRFIVELPHPRSYPVEESEGWQPFQPGVSCRSHGRGIQDVRLDEMKGLSTQVRILELEDISAWLERFSALACFEGYSNLPYDPEDGELMLVWAEK